MEIKRLDIKYLKNNTGQIKGLPKNPRILKDEKFNKLVKSIQDNPEMLDLRELIVYDNNGEMIYSNLWQYETKSHERIKI
jgi:hypothetical protein